MKHYPRAKELRKAKDLALKLRVMWKIVDENRNCMCEDCIMDSVAPLKSLAAVHGFSEFGEGVLKFVFIGEHWVIKIPRTSAFIAGLRHEAYRLIRWKDNPLLSRHLPETYFLPDGFMIQEKLQIINEAQWIETRPVIERLAEAHDIHDMHSWNVGWKDDTFVFFDLPNKKLADKMFGVYVKGHSQGMANHAKAKANA